MYLSFFICWPVFLYTYFSLRVLYLLLIAMSFVASAIAIDCLSRTLNLTEVDNVRFHRPH